ncbi:hypothetical protein BGZ76_000573 [Entomortierella beljakovae]|nr:hypothetical protein BGZ76_000573 [Entomortierella beljakovae]
MPGTIQYWWLSFSDPTKLFPRSIISEVKQQNKSGNLDAKLLLHAFEKGLGIPARHKDSLETLDKLKRGFKYFPAETDEDYIHIIVDDPKQVENPAKRRRSLENSKQYTAADGKSVSLPPYILDLLRDNKSEPDPCTSFESLLNVKAGDEIKSMSLGQAVWASTQDLCRRIPRRYISCYRADDEAMGYA